MGVPAVHDQCGAVEGGGEETLVALELQLVRHHVLRIRQHAIAGDDDIAFKTQGRHRRLGGYCETSVTTLLSGRELMVGSLSSLMTASSYCGSDCTGAFA